MPAKRTSARPANELFQFKVTLREVDPPVWRRFEIPAQYTLEGLHWTLQLAVGWSNSHMHEFAIGEKRWGEPDDDVMDESDVTLAELGLKVKARLVYTYDFGDGWEHDLVLEKVTVAGNDRPARPAVLEGEHAAPPEDCGGPWGYAHLREVLANPRHKEHGEMKEWAGDFDPDAFDLKGVNAELKRLR